MKTKGLTLTEVMITISIIGLLAAIVIPAATNYRETAEEAVCLENLNAIDNAKVQWAVDKGEPDSAEATEEELADYMIGDFPAPVVAGALYKVGSVITPALCSFHGNRFGGGSGLRLPTFIINLVRSGSLSVSDVLNGDWMLNHNNFLTGVASTSGLRYFSRGSDYQSPYQVIEGYYKLTAAKWGWMSLFASGEYAREDPGRPSITVGDSVLEGEQMSHYSPELVEYLRDTYPEDYYGLEYLSEMDEGGYCVYDRENIIDYRGERTVLSYNYYDDEGNFLGDVDRTYWKHRIEPPSNISPGDQWYTNSDSYEDDKSYTEYYKDDSYSNYGSPEVGCYSDEEYIYKTYRYSDRDNNDRPIRESSFKYSLETGELVEGASQAYWYFYGSDMVGYTEVTEYSEEEGSVYASDTEGHGYPPDECPVYYDQTLDLDDDSPEP